MSNFANLESLFNKAKEDHSKFETGNKAAGQRMRKALLDFEKESKRVRQESLKKD